MINFNLSSFLISTLDYSSSNAHTACKLILKHARVSGNGCVVVAPSASAWSRPAFWAVRNITSFLRISGRGPPWSPKPLCHHSGGRKLHANTAAPRSPGPRLTVRASARLPLQPLSPGPYLRLIEREHKRGC